MPTATSQKNTGVTLIFSSHALDLANGDAHLAALLQVIQNAVSRFEHELALKSPTPGMGVEPKERQESEPVPESRASARPLSTTIVTARRSIKQLINAKVWALDLTPNMYWMLRFIAHTEPISMTELAKEMRLDGPTVSRMVKEMSFRGYLTGERDPGHRRTIILRLTPDGERLCRELNRINAEFQEGAQTGLLAEEVAMMQKVLDKYIQNLDRMVASDQSNLIVQTTAEPASIEGHG